MPTVRNFLRIHAGVHVQSNLALHKERFDREQIGIKEPFPVTNLPFTS